MTEGINISTQALMDTAEKVRSINKNLDSKLHDINQCMNELESKWVSDACKEIRAKMNALNPKFEEYKTVVESYARFLVNTAQGYESTDRAILTNAEAFK